MRDVAVGKKNISTTGELHYFVNLRKIVEERLSDWCIMPDPIGIGRLNVFIPSMDNAINAITLCMIVIERSLIIDIHKDQQAAGNAECQPEDVDGGVDLLLAKVSPGDGEVVLKHSKAYFRNLLKLRIALHN